jgi:hypothetical protein
MEVVDYQRGYLDGIVAISEGIAFATSLSDRGRADRAMSADCATSLIALDHRRRPAGLPVDAPCLPRPSAQGDRLGAGRGDDGRLRGDQLDLLASEEAEALYETYSLPRHRGYRLCPDDAPGEVGADIGWAD